MLTEVYRTLDPEMKRKHCSVHICIAMLGGFLSRNRGGGAREGEAERHGEGNVGWGETDSSWEIFARELGVWKCYSLLT